jgi:hypothetical protein
MDLSLAPIEPADSQQSLLSRPVAGTIPAAGGRGSVNDDGSFVSTDRTRRFATVATQRPRSRGQSPLLRGGAGWVTMDRSLVPIESADSQQSLLSEPGCGDNPHSFGEGQRGRRWMFVRADRTRRFAIVATQRTRLRGQSPQLRGGAAWAAMDVR